MQILISYSKNDRQLHMHFIHLSIHKDLFDVHKISIKCNLNYISDRVKNDQVISKVEFLVKIKLEITKFNHVPGACKLHEKIQNILYFYEKINQPTINNIIKKNIFSL